MNDKRLREWFNGLESQVNDLRKQVNCGLKDLRIEECPLCKHDTLNERKNIAGGNPYLATAGFDGVFRILVPEYVFTCLTCGTKWEEKPVKRIINPKEVIK